MVTKKEYEVFCKMDDFITDELMPFASEMFMFNTDDYDSYSISRNKKVIVISWTISVFQGSELFFIFVNVEDIFEENWKEILISKKHSLLTNNS
jgi:hypothetical protein